MKKALMPALLCLFLLTSCAPKSETSTVFAMDTVMELTAYGDRASDAIRQATQEINRLDRLLSAQREESDVYRVNHAPGEATAVSPETAQLLEDTLALCAATDGALDLTVYPAMEAWGFPSGNYRVPGADELAKLRGLVDYRALEGAVQTASDPPTVTLPQGIRIDLGAVGKGRAGDRVMALWRSLGVESGLLNLGGNVQCLGAKPDGSDWTVAVRDPADDSAYLATVTGRDMAVVTSGAYQRNFTLDGVLYHHILDPKTCESAHSGLRSVTIVGESGFLCDGLSTAVYVMGLEDATELWRARRDFDMILCTDAGELYITAGLEGRVTPAEGLALQVLYG